MLRCASVMMWFVALALSTPGLPFTPREHGEQGCEDTFGESRAGSGVDRAPTFDMLIDRLQKAAYRVWEMLMSGLMVRNRQGKRCDAAGRAAAAQTPSLASELGCMDAIPFALLSQIFNRCGEKAFARVRIALDELGMISQLLEAGCCELSADAPAFHPFSLHEFVGPHTPPPPPVAAPPAGAGASGAQTVEVAQREAAESLAHLEEEGVAPMDLIVAAAQRMQWAEEAGFSELDSTAALLHSMRSRDLEQTVFEDETALDMLAAAAAQ